MDGLKNTAKLPLRSFALRMSLSRCSSALTGLEKSGWPKAALLLAGFPDRGLQTDLTLGKGASRSQRPKALRQSLCCSVCDYFIGFYATLEDLGFSGMAEWLAQGNCRVPGF